MTQDIQLTLEEKKATIKAFLKDQDRIRFADTVDKLQQNALLDRLIDTLLEDEQLFGKSINSLAQFILYHDSALPKNTPAFMLEMGDTIVVPVAMGSTDVAGAIKRGIDAAVARKEELFAEHDPSMPLDDHPAVTGYNRIIGSGLDEEGHSSINWNRNIQPRRKRRGPQYNPRAKTLHEGKAHTSGDLYDYGMMRRGGNERERWLWETVHDYVLSDEALAAKTPGRWFRDICVTCGVSTTLLDTRLEEGQTH